MNEARNLLLIQFFKNTSKSYHTKCKVVLVRLSELLHKFQSLFLHFNVDLLEQISKSVVAYFERHIEVNVSPY
jgi:hypothetical protein